MKVVGLISGGKDSILALHLAQSLGYHVVAVAHLKPKQEFVETDSYMYQSVASEAVAQIASKCLPDLKYFSRNIQGVPVKTDSNDYTATAGDEVEDLSLLLQDVLAEIPDIKGVVSGAIESVYQCKRVEQVCGRFGLISIAPLWKWSQLYLLRYLTTFPTEFDVRVVKCCTMGLDQCHLMQSLDHLADTLIHLNELVGVNLCGEGGEYETLTLRSPGYLGTLSADDWEVRIDSDKIITPVSSVVFRKELGWTEPEKTMPRTFAGRLAASPPIQAMKTAVYDTDNLYINCCGFESLEELIQTYPKIFSSCSQTQRPSCDSTTEPPFGLREVPAGLIDIRVHRSATMWSSESESWAWGRRGRTLMIAACEGLYPHNSNKMRSIGLELMLALRLLRFNLYEAKGSLGSLKTVTVVVHAPGCVDADEIRRFYRDFVSRNLCWNQETMVERWQSLTGGRSGRAECIEIEDADFPVIIKEDNSVFLDRIEIENFFDV